MSEQEHAQLVDRALRGEVTWIDVAVQERAHLGIVLFGTWNRLTAQEQRSVGRMPQGTARRLLGIAD